MKELALKILQQETDAFKSQSRLRDDVIDAMIRFKNKAMPEKLGGVVLSRLSPGDKLICCAKGGGYGDTFTVQDPMYEEGIILQNDKLGSFISLRDVDLSDFDYYHIN